jgi:Bacterial protein of unknown function (DUF885)
MHPHLATEKGHGGLDHLTADYRNQNVERFLLEMTELKSELSGLETSGLNSQQWVDYQLLGSQLDAVRHRFEYSNVLSQNPVFYLQAGLDGLESLRHRFETLPWDLMESRLKGLGPLLEVAQSQLLEPKSPALEVSIEMAGEAIDDIRATLLHPEIPESVRGAAEGALTDLKRFRHWLCQKNPGDFVPMGPEAFESLLLAEHHLERHWSVWESKARVALEQIEEELSKEPSLTTKPSSDLKPEDVWSYYRDEVDRVKSFLEQSQIVSIPQGELQLCQTPAYLESLIPGPFYLEPAVYSGARVGRFYMPSLPQEWTPEVARRYARKKRSGAFTNLVVHEAWPGHHLQFLHALDRHHPLRSLRDNDVMLEGWALYCEELMEEVGLHGSAPFWPRLHSLKFRTLRVLLDVGIHTGTLDLVQAERLMGQHMPGASRGWISAEIRRYALEPGQALSYWVGAQMIKELKAELGIQREHYREFHDALLSFGAIPLPLIRDRLRLTFGDRDERGPKSVLPNGTP